MLGLTQKELADCLNVNELTIRRLESGITPVKNSPTVRILLLNLKLLESSMKIKENVETNDEEELIEGGDPLTVGDVYNYCQRYLPFSWDGQSELTKEEFEELSNKVRKFISAWYDIEGDHQTRLEHAVRQCEEV